MINPDDILRAEETSDLTPSKALHGQIKKSVALASLSVIGFLGYQAGTLPWTQREQFCQYLYPVLAPYISRDERLRNIWERWAKSDSTFRTFKIDKT